jgi:hypothetical protein
VRPWLRRTIHSLVPLALAATIVAPVLPGPLGTAIAAQGRKISVLQTWNMYAPDPTRAHTYLSVRAELADGSSVKLDEALQADAGWGGIWDWQKRRTDIWRFYAALRPEEANANRTWYLRALCVREDRARGEAPVRIVAEKVRRGFTPPHEVAAGQPGLLAPTRAPVQKIDCAGWPERAMVAADRNRRGIPTEDPRPMPRARTRPASE